MLRPAIPLDRLNALLADDEGFTEWVIDDATGKPLVPGYTLVGHPTIWWGLCVEIGRVPSIPAEIPELVRDLLARRAAENVLKRLPFVAELPELTQLGLFAMAYQLGIAGLMRFDNMIGALAVGDLAAAEAHALDSSWAKKPPPVGTPKRAKRVAALIGNRGAA
jgi:lysozyme